MKNLLCGFVSAIALGISFAPSVEAKEQRWYGRYLGTNMVVKVGFNHLEICEKEKECLTLVDKHEDWARSGANQVAYWVKGDTVYSWMYGKEIEDRTLLVYKQDILIRSVPLKEDKKTTPPGIDRSTLCVVTELPEGFQNLGIRDPLGTVTGYLAPGDSIYPQNTIGKKYFAIVNKSVYNRSNFITGWVNPQYLRCKPVAK
jgi:hypothetical protein